MERAVLRIIDISNPENPEDVGEYNTDGTATSVTVAGNFAYVSDNASGLIVLDISNPENPIEMASYDTPGTAYDVRAVGDLAFVADGEAGFLIL